MLFRLEPKRQCWSVGTEGHVIQTLISVSPKSDIMSTECIWIWQIDCSVIFSLCFYRTWNSQSKKYLISWNRGWMDRWMDEWMGEFNITFTKIRHNRQAGTLVMTWMALVARMKLPSNMAAQGFEHGSFACLCTSISSPCYPDLH